MQNPPVGFVGIGTMPILYALITPLKADGTQAGNVGWACEGTSFSYFQNGDALNLVALTQGGAPQAGFPARPQALPGSSCCAPPHTTPQLPPLTPLSTT